MRIWIPSEILGVVVIWYLSGILTETDRYATKIRLNNEENMLLYKPNMQGKISASVIFGSRPQRLLFFFN